MTRISAYVQEAAVSLWRNRTRSLLTMLGMIIGSASIIAVFGLSKGATSGIAQTIASFGPSPIFVLVDRTQDYPEIAQIHYRDTARVASDLGSLAAEVVPLYQLALQVKHGSIARTYQVTGDGAYHPGTLGMAQGRNISQADVDDAARNAFLSSDVAQTFFGQSNPIGQDLTIGGSHFTVAGVYPSLQGTLFSGSVKNTVVVPYTTLYRVHPSDPDGLEIYAAPDASSSEVTDAAKRSLAHIHGARARYDVQDAQSIVSGFENVLNVAGTGLSAIGGVALVVAGIGIMNIMLVSVTERTREIGIRKSIGASRGDIMLQFLMEAVLLALFGGGTGMLVGLLVTIGGGALLSAQVGAVVIPYVLIVSIALGFSGAVGIIFGMYPAMRAALMDPIEALRA